MKILILSINYWPEVTGIGAFTTYRAEYLAGAGHDVEVCTSFPYYPEWRVPREYAGKFALTEEHNGVKIVRSYLYVPNPVTAVRRILHEASFIFSCTLRALMRRRPDVLLVVSPPLGLAATAILLSRVWRVPFVFDVEDLQPDSASDLEMLPAWAINLLYKLENAAYRNARLVTTLTASMKNKIVGKGIPWEKVEVLEPRMDDSMTTLLKEEGREFRRRYGLGEKFLVTHSGNMGVKQGLEVILNAAALNRADDSLLFLLVGDGADRKRVQQRAKELGLPNVRFLPLLDEDDFRGLLSASDVCLVSQQKGVTEIAFPSKIVTYLAAGRPIVASVNPQSEVARIIEKSGAGMIVEAEDAAGLLAAIQELRIQDPAAMGENGRRHARARWSAVPVLGHMEQCLSAVAGSAIRSIMKEGVSQ
ncbi:MAG: glycosyltransferase family 4 protein [Terracidiphilus sp.]|jgi:colanic acid biosynthesis glycosyl transferase WcaI